MSVVLEDRDAQDLSGYLQIDGEDALRFGSVFMHLIYTFIRKNYYLSTAQKKIFPNDWFWARWHCIGPLHHLYQIKLVIIIIK